MLRVSQNGLARHIFFALSFASALVPAAVARGSETTTATAKDLYIQALQYIKHSPQPVYASYAIAMDAQNVKLSIGSDRSGKPNITLSQRDGDAHLNLSAVYRSTDGTTAVKMADGRFSAVKSPFLSGTWLGAHDWMDFGEQGAPDAVSATTPPQARPASAALGVIATVTSLGTGYYRVEDGGATICPNGAPARAVHLTAWKDPDRHPLTEASVDLRTGGFCMMRFREKFNTLHPPFIGVLEFHFKNDGPYTVISDEHMEFTLRRLGVQIYRFTIEATYANFTFTNTVDPAIFSTAATQ